MLERQRMVLEGRVPVSLGRVAGVPRFGEEAEVRELEPFDQGGRLPELRSAPDARNACVDHCRS